MSFASKYAVHGTNGKRLGSAWLNRDGTINIYLDVLPLDGRLNLRESVTGEVIEVKTSDAVKIS